MTLTISEKDSSLFFINFNPLFLSPAFRFWKVKYLRLGQMFSHLPKRSSWWQNIWPQFTNNKHSIFPFTCSLADKYFHIGPQGNISVIVNIFRKNICATSPQVLEGNKIFVLNILPITAIFPICCGEYENIWLQVAGKYFHIWPQAWKHCKL